MTRWCSDRSGPRRPASPPIRLARASGAFELQILQTKLDIALGRASSCPSPRRTRWRSARRALAPAVAVGDRALSCPSSDRRGVAHQPRVRRFGDEARRDPGPSATAPARGRRRRRCACPSRRPCSCPRGRRPFRRAREMARGLQIGHEPGHLDDPQPALDIPVDDDRILDRAARLQRARAIAGWHVERLQRLGRRQRGESAERLLNLRRPRPVDRRGLLAGGRHHPVSISSGDRSRSREQHETN